MEPIFEREFLYKSADVPLTGFTEKPINRLASFKQPSNLLTIETNHLKRDFPKDTKDIVPLLEYQLWLEAGKLDKANLRSQNADSNVTINSNVWRNFCSSVGIQPALPPSLPPTSRHSNNPKSPRKQRITEAVATLYPINVPMPSRLGSNTLSKFYEQNKRDLFANEKSFSLARERVEKEDARMRMLRLKSEMRNPPLDWHGNILPPANFKKFPSMTTSTQSRAAAASELSIPNLTLTTSAKGARDTNTATSLVTSEYNPMNDYSSILSVKKRSPVVKKLVYRQNHPDFNKVVKEQQLKNTFKISANMV